MYDIIDTMAIYVHDFFSFNRLDTEIFKQNSTVYESMYLEIYNKDASFHKYVMCHIIDHATGLFTMP